MLQKAISLSDDFLVSCSFLTIVNVITQTNKLQESDKQTGMANDCFLQMRKPSVFQNHIFETKTLPTFPLFLSEHAYVV